MKIRLLVLASLMSILLWGCSSDKVEFDASGAFEVDEVIVSSETSGQIKELHIREGSVLTKDSIVGYIDSIPLTLQKAKLEATISTFYDKTIDVKPQVKLLQDQIAVLQVQLDNIIHEKERTERLIKSDVATQKQLDNLTAQTAVYEKQIAVSQQQIEVQKSTIGSQNRSILSELRPLKKSVEQIEDQLMRTRIKNPTNGTVLTKYAMEGEFANPGKALYSIGDLSVMTLRVYVTGDQFAQIKLNQPVKVFVDYASDSKKQYSGTITWISDKSEFTPKTIQTKNERANLVYAIKIYVKNDGLLKIGMYGEVKFN